MTRAVVVISKVRLWGPLLMLEMGLFVNMHDAPGGSDPGTQESETDCVNPAPVGVTKASNVATPPAITEAAEGGTMLTT